MYVDSHIHLADPQYAGKVGAVIHEAEEANVSHILSCGVDAATSRETIRLAKLHPGKVFAAVGIHPWTVVNSPKIQLDEMKQLLEDEREHILAVGEIGLDGQYSQRPDDFEKQREVFDYFLSLAKENSMPVVVHSRLAPEAALEMISARGLDSVMMHWYSGPVELVQRIVESGYMISVGPALAYSKRVREVAKHAPLEALLTETDGPVPFHGPFEGRTTTPAFIPVVVSKLAELKGNSEERTREHVLKNFRSLFKLKALGQGSETD